MDYTELEVEKILWHTLCKILGTPVERTLSEHGKAMVEALILR